MDENSEDSINLELLYRLRNVILPCFEEGFDRPLEQADFDEVQNKYDVFIPIISERFNEYISDWDLKYRYELLVSSIILCGENHEVSRWCALKNVEICCKILECLPPILDCKDFQHLIFCDSGKILKMIIRKLRPCLLSCSWKKYPTAVACYCWILTFIKSPILDDYMTDFLPTALIISDDFVVENKLIGTNCLIHIIKNVTSSRLKALGHDEVIYKTVELGYSEKDPTLCEMLTECMLLLLKKIYLQQGDTVWKTWSKYDDFLSKYCYMMRLELDLDMRRVLISYLPNLIESSRLSTVRSLKSLNEVLEEYCFDLRTAFNALQVVDMILDVCQRGIDRHLEDLIMLITKVLYQVAVEKPSNHKEITEKCSDIIRKIHLCQPVILNKLSSDEKYCLIDEEIRNVFDSSLQ